jgi:hypothetical protein
VVMSGHNEANVRNTKTGPAGAVAKLRSALGRNAAGPEPVAGNFFG